MSVYANEKRKKGDILLFCVRLRGARLPLNLGGALRGTVRLDARQAGRFVEILVSDDGRGIEPTAVAEAAVRKGLLSEADVGRMSETEILRQLFRPAFLTRTNVSDVSGRGVGLDVVKSTIEDFGGSVRIESEVGQGTTFVLRLPVSIALVDALVIDLEHALYAVPSAYVAESGARARREGICIRGFRSPSSHGTEVASLKPDPGTPLRQCDLRADADTCRVHRSIHVSTAKTERAYRDHVDINGLVY